MRLLDLGNHNVVFEEYGGGHDQDGGIDKKRAVQRQGGIEQIESASRALLSDCLADTACLDERRMQIEVMRHDCGAEDGYGDIDARGIEAGQKASDDFGYIRLGKKDFECEAPRDGCDEHQHERFDDTYAE